MGRPVRRFQNRPGPPGFLLGIDQVLHEYREKGSGKLLVSGHSLCAARESRSYRTGRPGTFKHDLVTDVPYRIGLLTDVHPTPLIDVSAPPPPGDEWGIFGYHHMQLYAQAVAR